MLISEFSLTEFTEKVLKNDTKKTAGFNNLLELGVKKIKKSLPTLNEYYNDEELKNIVFSVLMAYLEFEWKDYKN